MKKAEIVADQIEQTIVGQRWEPGDLFGSEVQLIARYGVSRAVFREAVRLLEHHGLAEMRRGLHGGLFIRQPEPAPDRNRLSRDDIHAAHAQIAEAIIARDGALARHRMMTHREEVSAAGPRRPRLLRGEPAEPVVS